LAINANKLPTTMNPVPRIEPSRVTPFRGKNHIEKIDTDRDRAVSIRAIDECFIVILCLINLL
jgi:hypothetical protein